MRFLSIGITAALTVTLLAPSPSLASPAATAPADPVPELAALDVVELEEQLAEESLDLEAIEVAPEAIDLTLTSTLASGTELETVGELDVEESRLVLAFDSSSTVVADGEIVMDVVELHEDAIVVQVEDPETGETVTIDGTSGEFAAIPLVIGIPIGISLLKALFAATAVVVVAGVTYLAAAEAIEAIRDRGSNYQHFAAIRRSAGLFIGNGMSLTAAIQRGRSSNDTWSRTQSGARAVAYGVNNRTPVGPEIDASGANKYWHYHPSNRRPAMHAFYGTGR